MIYSACVCLCMCDSASCVSLIGTGHLCRIGTLWVDFDDAYQTRFTIDTIPTDSHVKGFVFVCETEEKARIESKTVYEKVPERMRMQEL